MTLPVIAVWAALSAAALPSDAPVVVALKPSLAGARSVNGTVDIRTIVDLTDAGRTPEEQARSYFDALLGSSVELALVGVDHTPRGTVVHFKQVTSGNIIEATHAMAVINRAVLSYASMRLVRPQTAQAAGPQADPRGAQAAVLTVASTGHGAPTLVWRVPARNAALALNSSTDAHAAQLVSK